MLSKETMKLLGSTKDIIDADKNSENVPKLENIEVALVHCNLVNNAYQQHSRVLFTIVLLLLFTWSINYYITTFISIFKNDEHGFFRNRSMVYKSKQ